MKPIRKARSRAALLAAAFALPLAMSATLAPAPASAEVQFGSLSNFDVFNDSGEETHGFEIELDGISSSDISYTFGAPYQYRYGTPRLENFPGGVRVFYESPYDTKTGTFTMGTPLAPKPITPTMGHQCWTGGSVNYLTSGCEHFGIGLLKNPTNTVYHWLVANPSKPGSLMQAVTKVAVPTPEFVVKPPTEKQPQPVVKAVVKAPEPDLGQLWGDAVWVKVYETETEGFAELNHLLTDDPAVPQEAAQTEIEWVLMQKEKGIANAIGDVASEKPLGVKKESVTRRYEIFAYNGKYDVEHEAVPAINDNTPAPGEVGEYLGAQMDAANIPAVAEEPPTVTKVGPKAGPASGGTTVKITGTGFYKVTAVRFGSNDATSYKINNASTLITAVAPAGASGVTDITVITAHGASAASAADHYKYLPTVTGVSPKGGPVAGGNTVTVTGSGFSTAAGGTLVKFGTAKATGVTCASSTECTVKAPAHVAGTVEVKVTVSKITSGKTALGAYTYS